MKKVFLLTFAAALAPVLGLIAAAPQYQSQSSSARPAMGRAPIMPNLNIMTAGTMVASGTTTSNAASCAHQLPDQISASRCIQKYMACMKQDVVCGEHFENCDTKNRFNGKMIFCQDKLMECPDDAITAIYGAAVKSTTTTATCDGELAVVARTFSIPSGGLGKLDFTYKPGQADQPNMIAQAIYDGTLWIAANSFKACVATADSCIRRACQDAPFKCVLNGDSLDYVSISDTATNVNSTKFRVPPSMVERYVKNMVWSSSSFVPDKTDPDAGSWVYDHDLVQKYIKGACETEVGASRACYMVSKGEAPKSDAWQVDQFEVNEVYSDIMTMKLNRLNANQNKILEWLAKSVGTAIDKCKSTARDCVTNTCGSGSLASCYGLAKQQAATDKRGELSLNIAGIGAKCRPIINFEQSCRDLLADKNSDEDLWDKIWDTNMDKFGVLAQLEIELAQMFNESSLARSRKQCQIVAESCVRRECGEKFVDCYINDDNAKWEGKITASSGGDGETDGTDGTSTRKRGDNYGKTILDEKGLATAMLNATGGFDVDMAKSLCAISVKKSEACQVYYDVEFAKNLAKEGSFSSFGSWQSLTTSWNSVDGANRVCTIANSDDTKSGKDSEDSDVSSTPAPECKRQSEMIFMDLIADVAAEARAQLTKEQNALKRSCEQHRGQSSFGDAYTWVSKSSIGDVVPDDYGVKGLSATNKGTETLDLWGSFCRVRVGLTSTDSRLQEMFQGTFKDKDDKAITAPQMSAYFSLGDTVMCGSWLDQSALNEIEKKIRNEAEKKVENGNFAYSNIGKWVITGASALGGAYLGSNLGYSAGQSIGDKLDSGETKIEKGKKEKALETLGCGNEANGLLKMATGSVAEVGKNPPVANKFLSCTVEDTGTWTGIKGLSSTVIVYKYTNCDYTAAAKPSVDYQKTANDQLASVTSACSRVMNAKEVSNPNATGGAEKMGMGIGALLGGAAGGFTAYQIIDTVKNIEVAKAADKAVAEWFDTVGKKIQCTVGGRVVGSYGDLVELK